jgi:hypothetical protein
MPHACALQERGGEGRGYEDRQREGQREMEDDDYRETLKIP